MLGHYAVGSLKDLAKIARLDENKVGYSDQKSSVTSLLNDHETIIRSLRKDLDEAQNKYKDAGTADFLTGLMEQHEKMAWMLRAYVQ
jgi:starvation-inducible DNA-binding protein